MFFIFFTLVLVEICCCTICCCFSFLCALLAHVYCTLSSSNSHPHRHNHPLLQASITEQAKDAYNTLVGGSGLNLTNKQTTATVSGVASRKQSFKELGCNSNPFNQNSEASAGKKLFQKDDFIDPVLSSTSSEKSSSPPPPLPPHSLHLSNASDPLGNNGKSSKDLPSFSTSSAPENTEQHSNPLRMLRAGVTVRPKVRGNKHNFQPGFATVDRNSHRPMSSYRDAGGASSTTVSHSFDIGPNQTLPKGFKTSRSGAPSILPKAAPRIPESGLDSGIEERLSNLSLGGSSSTNSSTLNGSSESFASNNNNPLPLPPRDRTKSAQNFSKPRHQRKHPLIMPSVLSSSLLRASGSSAAAHSNDSKNDCSPSRLVIQHTHNPLLENTNPMLAKMPGLIDAGPRATTAQKNLSTTNSSSPSGSPSLGHRSGDDGFDEVDTGEGLLSMMGLNGDGSLNLKGPSDLDDDSDIGGGSSLLSVSCTDSGKMPPAKPPRLFPWVIDFFAFFISLPINRLFEPTYRMYEPLISI